jgi:hypothetical protein
VSILLVRCVLVEGSEGDRDRGWARGAGVSWALFVVVVICL